LINAYGSKVDIINRGFSGYTTRLAKLILPRVFLENDPLPKPLAVTIFLGANDASTKLQHVPLNEYKQNLKEIVQYIEHCYNKDKESPISTVIFLIAPPPFDIIAWNAYCKQTNNLLGVDRGHNDITKRYAAACVEVATTMNLDCIDLWTLMMKNPSWAADYFVDGLHFNAKGNQLLFESLMQLIERKYPHLKPANLMADFLSWRELLAVYFQNQPISTSNDIMHEVAKKELVKHWKDFDETHGGLIKK
jgi:lysophospholipase L1-like esterase